MLSAQGEAGNQTLLQNPNDGTVPSVKPSPLDLAFSTSAVALDLQTTGALSQTYANSVAVNATSTVPTWEMFLQPRWRLVDRFEPIERRRQRTAVGVGGRSEPSARPR